MAAIVRFGIKCVNSNPTKLLSNNTELRIQFRGISGKALRSAFPQPPKPAPWPYKDKSFTLFNHIYDKTTARLDENSKIIIIEGPVAAGKTKLAKALAEDLNMLHLPEANQDMLYTNEYGYNLRKLDPQMPELCRSYDERDFLLNPKHKLSTAFQLRQLTVKVSQYIDALAHVLSTGQGVILERSPFSDFVFVEAMASQGYMSKGACDLYYDARRNGIYELLRPHLVIYLDVSVNKVLEKIKQRNYSCEVNSSVLTPEYLRVMENNYKQNYLKDISTHAELLVYDWSEEGDVDVVVEDVERIDFNRFDKQDKKMKDWYYLLEEEWACMRNLFADKKEQLMASLNIPRFDVPEVMVAADDVRAYYEILQTAPGEEFQYGYNQQAGDKGLLFKIGARPRETLPLIERSLN